MLLLSLQWQMIAQSCCPYTLYKYAWFLFFWFFVAARSVVWRIWSKQSTHRAGTASERFIAQCIPAGPVSWDSSHTAWCCSCYSTCEYYYCLMCVLQSVFFLPVVGPPHLWFRCKSQRLLLFWSDDVTCYCPRWMSILMFCICFCITNNHFE